MISLVPPHFGPRLDCNDFPPKSESYLHYKTLSTDTPGGTPDGEAALTENGESQSDRGKAMTNGESQPIIEEN